MKIRFYLCLILFSINTTAQQFDFNFIIIAEVGTSECDAKENVFFTTPVLTTRLDNLIDRHDFLESANEFYLLYLDDLIAREYPEYYNDECILDINRWAFFEEWALVNTERLKEHVNRKYQSGKIIPTDFKLESDKVSDLVKNNEIDPNQALIDAYYLQAKKEYEAKNYNKCFSVLEKAKGLLDGKKNINIMLLEAKSKVVIDKNMNETKALLNDFVKEAAKEKDNRLNEGANMLVTLETSDLYHDTGFKKEYEYTTTSEFGELKCIDKLDKNGNVLFSKQLNSSWNDSVFKEVDNSVPNEQKIVYYNQNGSVKNTEYYTNGLPFLFTFNKQNRADYYHQGELIQSVVYNEDKANMTVFKSNGNSMFTIKDISILNKAPLELKSKITNTAMDLGRITEIKELLEKEEFNTYTFDSLGLPKEKLYHKKEGKVKETYRFEKSSSSWALVK